MLIIILVFKYFLVENTLARFFNDVTGPYLIVMIFHKSIL